MVALLFSAIILAAALRPGVERLAGLGVPRGNRRRPPLRGARRARRRGSVVRRPRRDRPGAGRARRPAPAPPGGPRVDGDQARHPRRARPEAERRPLGLEPRRPGGRVRPEGVRGAHRDVLRARGLGLLDRRARPRGRPRLLAPAAPEAQDRAGHLGSDRAPARRLRARPGSAGRVGRDGALRRASGRSACRTGCSSACSPAWSRSCP